MKSYSRFMGLAAASVNLGIISTLAAQSPAPGPTAAPSVMSDNAPTAAITFPGGPSVAMRSKSGKFPFVASMGGQTVGIQLRLPAGVARSLIVTSLDGGALSAGAQSSAVATDGTTSFQFQSAGKPGLYRVLLNDNGMTTLLQFWVADPQNPNSNPPALQAH